VFVNSFIDDLAYIEILKQKDRSALELLHYSYISSIAWNICQVISEVKGVNQCRIMLGRSVQNSGENGEEKNFQSLLFTFKLDCWTFNRFSWRVSSPCSSSETLSLLDTVTQQNFLNVQRT
jgi:hypothetical protein